MTIYEKVKNYLKEKWYSNYQMNLAVHSVSGAREINRIKNDPPEGYVVKQRTKKEEGYNTCLEYKLVKKGEDDE